MEARKRASLTLPQEATRTNVDLRPQNAEQERALQPLVVSFEMCGCSFMQITTLSSSSDLMHPEYVMGSTSPLLPLLTNIPPNSISFNPRS